MKVFQVSKNCFGSGGRKWTGKQKVPSIVTTAGNQKDKQPPKIQKLSQRMHPYFLTKLQEGGICLHHPLTFSTPLLLGFLVFAVRGSPRSDVTTDTSSSTSSLQARKKKEKLWVQNRNLGNQSA